MTVELFAKTDCNSQVPAVDAASMRRCTAEALEVQVGSSTADTVLAATVAADSDIRQLRVGITVVRFVTAGRVVRLSALMEDSVKVRRKDYMRLVEGEFAKCNRHYYGLALSLIAR